MSMHTNFFGAEYLDASETLTRVYNLPKLMSSANRKEFHNVDNQGNAQLYTVGMRVWGTNVESLASTAPNTYVTRRAVKAWHDARVKMYKRAGISMKSLGYGRSLRPYLDVNHENASVTEIATQSDLVGTDASGIYPAFTGDEWTYSRAAVATPAENTNDSNTGFRDMVDTYSFTLCDASVPESTTADSPDESGSTSDQDSFVSVGMLKEWIGSFKKRISIANDNNKVDEDNALLQLVSQQGADKEEVLELVAESQKEGRPWDLGGSTHYSTTVQQYTRASNGESGYVVFQAPCGLFGVALQNDHSAAEKRQVLLRCPGYSGYVSLMEDWESEIVKPNHPIWRILLVLCLGLLGLGGLSTTDLLAGVI